jgi:hypothetical protein
VTLLGRETPLPPPLPQVEHWSENFCLASFDPRLGIGLWLHIGRWRKDLELWRETVVVTWPDGSVTGYRAFGNARSSDQGPGGANFAIRLLETGGVEDPRRSFSYSFLGGVQRTVSAAMRAGLLLDGPRHRLSLELSFLSRSDIWDLHRIGGSQEFVGTGHIEQIGRVRGTIGFGDARYDFDSLGNRDHSMGRRDTSSLGAHHWMQAYFDNGLSVLVYDAVLRGAAQPVVSEAVVYEGDRLFAATLRLTERISAVADGCEEYGFSVDYEHGRLEIRTAGIHNTAYLSFTVPNDHYIGVYPGGEPPLTLMEQPSRFILNGAIGGYGWMERTVPGVIGVD